jgi:hypothetical protein
MRKILNVVGVAAMLVFGVASGLAQGKTTNSSAGTIVIVFKDGHRQSFNLADVARVEFPGASGVAAAGPTPAGSPPRGHFFGKWEVGDGNGGTFLITLKENGDAYRSLGNVHGKWVYQNGEAQITWDDGDKDAIRKVGSTDKKCWYRAGNPFTGEPDNVADAKNTSPRPI